MTQVDPKGGGLPKDAVEAVKWYRKAADQGHASAQYELSPMSFTYKNSEGVPKHKQMNGAEESALAARLMKHYKPSKGVRLEASWCNDEVVVRVRLTPEEWKVVASGDAFEKRGTSYSYEGEGFTTNWNFNDLELGSVTVSYSSRRLSGDSGDGYEGSIEELIQ